MDHNLLESISKALKTLQKDQAALSNKLIKVTEVCRNKFAKVEREQADNHAYYEEKLEQNLKLNEDLKKHLEQIEKKNAHESIANEMKISDIAEKSSELEARFEAMDDTIEGLKREEDKHIADLCNIENEREKVSNQINFIDEALKEIKNQDIDDNETRKQCKYDRNGFCRQAENCLFSHADKTCEIYLETGVCWKLNCHQRHPKRCWYGSKCYRGESCRYLHQETTCYKCQQFSHTVYYCEFCQESFCSSCTVKQAHFEKLHSEDHKCENIHQ